MQRLLAGASEPRHVVGIFHAFQEFFIVLDGNDDGDGLAFARDDFRFGQCCFYGGNLSGGRSDVKLAALCRRTRSTLLPLLLAERLVR